MSDGIGSGVGNDGDGRRDVDVSSGSTDLTNSNCWCDVRVSTVESAGGDCNGRSAYLTFGGGDSGVDARREEGVGDRSGLSLLVENVGSESWDLGSGEGDDDGSDESRESDDVDHFERID